MPDLRSEAKKPIDRLAMAFVACNRLDRAEFLIRRPTLVKDEAGNELCKVL